MIFILITILFANEKNFLPTMWEVFGFETFHECIIGGHRPNGTGTGREDRETSDTDLDEDCARCAHES